MRNKESKSRSSISERVIMAHRAKSPDWGRQDYRNGEEKRGESCETSDSMDRIPTLRPSLRLGKAKRTEIRNRTHGKTTTFPSGKAAGAECVLFYRDRLFRRACPIGIPDGVSIHHVITQLKNWLHREPLESRPLVLLGAARTGHEIQVHRQHFRKIQPH